MKPMTSSYPKPGYRAAPTVSQALGTCTNHRESGGLQQVSESLAKSQPPQNLTTFPADAKLNACGGVGSVVYFAASAGLVKVGTTTDLKQRLKQLRLGSAAPIEILGAGPGDKLREQHLHELLDASRHHGEWFEPSSLLMEWLEHARTNSWKWQRLPPFEEKAEGPITYRQHLQNEEATRRFQNSPIMRRLRALEAQP